MNNDNSRDIQMVITFHSDVRFRCIIYRDAQNLTRKLSANSNGYKFWLGCTIEDHDISRCSKMNNGSSSEIQKVITFHSDVRFRHIIYLESRNWTRKLYANSNDCNFSLGCMIETHDIFRRSKMNNKSSDEIQKVINFHSDCRFRHIIYRDARNWKTELSRNSNSHNFPHGGQIQAHNISRRSKLNNGSSQEYQIVITFNSDVWFRRIIYWDSRNWRMEDLFQFKWS